MAIRYTITHIQSIAKEHGGKCLSKEYINDSLPLAWMCKHGHTWDAPYSIIRQGGWCRQCAKKEAMLERLQEIAESKGGKCLSTEYSNRNSIIKLKCEKGHEWETKAYNIQGGYWCPVCGGRTLSITDMQAMAAKHGGKCISKKYIDTFTKLKWQCANGHTWMIEPRQIKRRSWCPHCVIEKKRNSIGNMRKLAKSKGGKCLSEKYVNRHVSLKWQCKNGHTWMSAPANIIRGSWCHPCAMDEKRLTIEDMRNSAKDKGGKCLSESYEGIFTKLKWQCSEGHVWMANPHAIRLGHWCRACAIKKRIDMMRGNMIEEYKAIAKKHGGILISKKYINSDTPLRWECKEGHRWTTSPGTVKSGHWCPKCSKDKVSKSRRQNQQLKKIKI